MITAVTVEKTAGERKGNKLEGFNISINLGIDSVKGEEIKMKYDFIVNYGKEAGYVVVSGYIIAKETKERAQEIEKFWKEKKKLPDDYKKVVANNIAIYGTGNASIIAKVLNFPPPIVPPPMKDEDKKEEKK